MALNLKQVLVVALLWSRHGLRLVSAAAFCHASLVPPSLRDRISDSADAAPLLSYETSRWLQAVPLTDPGFGGWARAECLPSQDDSEPLCVFSSPAYASGRGIAVVTTPSQASRLLEAMEYWHTHALETAEPPEASMEERIFPGAGRGLAAGARLGVGDTVIRRPPIILLNAMVERLDLAGADALRWAAVRALPKDTQEIFWNIAASDPHSQDAVFDRFTTNAYGARLFGGNYMMISPEAARMNHHCRPNVVYHFDNATLTHRASVVRATEPGEQLVVTYIRPMQLHSERQKLLLGWGFRCACQACVADSESIERSDSRVHELRNLLSELEDDNSRAKHRLTAAQAIIMAHRALEITEQERLQIALTRPLIQLILAYSSIGNRSQLEKYGQRGLQHAILEYGTLHPLTTRIRELLVRPDRHSSWQQRVGNAS